MLSEYEKCRFSDKELVGEGAYGSVYKAYDECFGEYVIIKKTKDKELEDDRVTSAFSGVRTKREVDYSIGQQHHTNGNLFSRSEFQLQKKTKDRIDAFPSTSVGVPHDFIREIAALMDCRGHENIVYLHEALRIKGTSRIMMSLQFEKGGSLADLLH